MIAEQRPADWDPVLCLSPSDTFTEDHRRIRELRKKRGPDAALEDLAAEAAEHLRREWMRYHRFENVRELQCWRELMTAPVNTWDPLLQAKLKAVGPICQEVVCEVVAEWVKSLER